MKAPNTKPQPRDGAAVLRGQTPSVDPEHAMQEHKDWITEFVLRAFLVLYDRRRWLGIVLVLVLVLGIAAITLIRSQAAPAVPPPQRIVYLSQDPARIVWVTNYVDVAIYTLSATDNAHNQRVLAAALAGAEMGWKWAHWGSSRAAVSNSVVQTWEYLFKDKQGTP